MQIPFLKKKLSVVGMTVIYFPDSTHTYFRTGYGAVSAQIAGGDRRRDLISFVSLNVRRATPALKLGVCALKVGYLLVRDLCEASGVLPSSQNFFLSVQQATTCRRWGESEGQKFH